MGRRLEKIIRQTCLKFAEKHIHKAKLFFSKRTFGKIFNFFVDFFIRLTLDFVQYIKLEISDI